MRIKVVRVKNKSNYTIKALLTIIVIAILLKYYYARKNIDVMHLLNAAKYKEIMCTEISLMTYVANESKTIKNGKSQEIISFIDAEIGVIKEVNSQNFINNYTIDDKENSRSQNAISSEDTDEETKKETVVTKQEPFKEPEVRPSNRSIGICNSR